MLPSWPTLVTTTFPLSPPQVSSVLMAKLRFAVLLSALALVAAQVGRGWPDRPLAKELGLEEHYESVAHHARMLAETQAAAGYSDDEIAMFQFMAMSSIITVFVFYFAMMAMVNMDYANDSILYSKAKGD